MSFLLIAIPPTFLLAQVLTQTCTAANRDVDRDGLDCDDQDARKNPWAGNCN